MPQQVQTGPDGVPVPAVPLTRLLDDASASFPTRTALTWAGTSLTYRELRDVTDHLAAGLAGLGVRKGDHVAVVLPSCPQFVLTVFAVLRLGAVVVPCDPQSPAVELEQRLRSCRAAVAVCVDSAHAPLAEVRGPVGLQHLVVTSLVDYLPASARLRLRLPTPGARRGRDRLTTRVPADADVVPFVRLLKSARAARQTAVDPETDVAVVHHGLDGAGPDRTDSDRTDSDRTDSDRIGPDPIGPDPVDPEPAGVTAARLTHLRLVRAAYLSRAGDVGARPGEDVVVLALPLHSPQGLAACFDALLLGGELVLPGGPRGADVVQAVERHTATVLITTSAVLTQVAQRTRVADLRSLRLCVSEDGALPPEVHRRLALLSGALVHAGRGTVHDQPPTHRDRAAGPPRAAADGPPDSRAARKTAPLPQRSA